jgi:hypothetical protein
MELDESSPLIISVFLSGLPPLREHCGIENRVRIGFLTHEGHTPLRTDI